MQKDVYPIIGMSPGNSYFKDDEVRFLLKEIVHRYGKAAVFIADIPAVSTYMALGYQPGKARNKAILKGNNLKNRTKKMMVELNLHEDVVHIIDWEKEVADALFYKTAFQAIVDLYQANSLFAESVNAATSEVLKNAGKEERNLPDAVSIGVHYLLSEIAYLECAPAFFHTKKITYVYHKPWPIYEEYIAGTFDDRPKAHLGFLLLTHSA